MCCESLLQCGIKAKSGNSGGSSVDRCFQRGKRDLKTVLKSLKYQLSEKTCFQKFHGNSSHLGIFLKMTLKSLKLAFLFTADTIYEHLTPIN